MKHQDVEHLLAEARGVLDRNWTGTYTRPTASGLYPHQWSWDSGFIAIGYAHGQQARAEQELRTLFSAQWKNGLLPHIVFHDPKASYFPNAEVWQSLRCPHAPDHVQTSGIVQPPIHATAVWWIYTFAQDQDRARAFLREMFPKLKAWHDYLYRERDPHDEGLVYIRHPWESGMDDSPLWDTVLERIPVHRAKRVSHLRMDVHQVRLKDRPTHHDYTRYLALIDIFREARYDETHIRNHCPFLVQDALFNTLLCQAEQDLAKIAEVLGEDPTPHRLRAEKTAQALRHKLWDDRHGLFIDYDLNTDTPIEKHTAAGFTPLFAGIPTPQQAEAMLEYLNSKAFCPLHGTCFAVPTYDRHSPGFSEHRYWRGPIWININWLLYRGLQRHRFTEYAGWVRQAIIELPQKYGFYEYFNPEEGAGHGTEGFSWTASLLIDVLMDPSVESPAKAAGDGPKRSRGG